MLKLNIEMTRRDGLTFSGYIKPRLLVVIVVTPVIGAALPWAPVVARALGWM